MEMWGDLQITVIVSWYDDDPNSGVETSCQVINNRKRAYCV
jgi:hypothetical protein